MRHSFLPALFTCILLLTAAACHRKTTETMQTTATTGTAGCSPTCAATCTGSTTPELVCTLTSAELQQRKETVLASLRRQVLEKRELSDGYAFRFAGSDEVLDELLEFIKTERTCCAFFTFGLSVSGDGREAWLQMTGAPGVKYFIEVELGL